MKKLYNNVIVVDPEIRFGKPCIKGTRITIEDILNLIAAGYYINEIPKEFPGITEKDVIAAIKFAAEISTNPIKIFKEDKVSV